MAQNGHIAALYGFADLQMVHKLAARLRFFGPQERIEGTLLLASEGINGTIAAPSRLHLARYLRLIRDVPGLARLELKLSQCTFCPFTRFKIKVKKEIVTFRQPQIDPRRDAGLYVEPEDWNALIDDPEVLLIDTRNHYEYAVGHFRNAVDPQTRDFTAFARYVREHLDLRKHRKVAMYCTGGIRCEKASALLKREGVAEVYHLHGGILKYLERVHPSQSRWQGECFVFDHRVAVDHALQPTQKWIIDASTYLPAPK